MKAPEQSTNSDALIETAPCASRMHEISGPMLMYYALNKRLPSRLDELRPMADIGQELNFSCPTSGEKYVYVPTGLSATGQQRRLILYDANPVHNGHRWAIMMTDAAGDQPAAMWVVSLSEEILSIYRAGPKLERPPIITPPVPRPAGS